MGKQAVAGSAFGRFGHLLKCVRIWLAVSLVPQCHPQGIRRPGGRPRLIFELLGLGSAEPYRTSSSRRLGAPARMNVISATQTNIHVSVHFRYAGSKEPRTLLARVARLLPASLHGFR